MLKKHTVFQASLILTFSALLGRAIGFLREIIIAHTFGASVSYDVYLVAITFPIVITSIFLYTIPSVFIPLYLDVKIKKSKTKAWEFGWIFLNTYSMIFLVISILVLVFARRILNVYAPSLSISQVNESVSILKISSGIILFGGIFSILKSILNANKHFIFPAIAPLFLNVMIIISVVFFSKNLRTQSLAIGFTVGYLIQALILFVPFISNNKTGFIFINLREKIINKSFGILIFILIIETIGQLNVVIDRSFISILPGGCISSLNYANTLNQISIAVFGITMGTAIFPSISEFVTEEKWDHFITLFSKAIRSLLVLMIPIAIVFISFAKEIVTVIFQRGAFTETATRLTSEALMVLSVGLVASVAHAVIVKTFYALKKNTMLLLSILFSILIKFVLSILLVRSYYHLGLAASTSCAAIFNVLFLFILLKRQFNNINIKQILLTFIKILIASLFSFGLSRLLYVKLDFMSLDFLRLVLSLSIGFLSFIALSVLFKVEEVKFFIIKVKSKYVSWQSH